MDGIRKQSLFDRHEGGEPTTDLEVLSAEKVDARIPKATKLSELYVEHLSPMYEAVYGRDATVEHLCALDTWELPDLDGLVAATDARLAALAEAGVDTSTASNEVALELARVVAGYTVSGYYDTASGRPRFPFQSALGLDGTVGYLLGKVSGLTTAERQRVIETRLTNFRLEILGHGAEEEFEGDRRYGAIHTFLTSDRSNGWLSASEKKSTLHAISNLSTPATREKLLTMWLKDVGGNGSAEISEETSPEVEAATAAFDAVWEQFVADTEQIHAALDAVEYNPDTAQPSSPERIAAFLEKNHITENIQELGDEAARLRTRVAELWEESTELEADKMLTYFEDYNFEAEGAVELLTTDEQMVERAERVMRETVAQLERYGLLQTDIGSFFTVPISVVDPASIIGTGSFMAGKIKIPSIKDNPERQRMVSLTLDTVIRHETIHAIQSEVAKKRLPDPSWNNQPAILLGPEGSTQFAEIMMLPLLAKEGKLRKEDIAVGLINLSRTLAYIGIERDLHVEMDPSDVDDLIEQQAQRLHEQTGYPVDIARRRVASMMGKPGKDAVYALGLMNLVAMAEKHYKAEEDTSARATTMAWIDQLNMAGGLLTPAMVARAAGKTERIESASAIPQGDFLREIFDAVKENQR